MPSTAPMPVGYLQPGALHLRRKISSVVRKLPEAEARAEPPLLLRLSFRNVTMPLEGLGRGARLYFLPFQPVVNPLPR